MAVHTWSIVLRIGHGYRSRRTALTARPVAAKRPLDPIGAAILNYLNRRECGAEPLPPKAPNDELSWLRVAELVEGRREGKCIYYRVLPETFAARLLELLSAPGPASARLRLGAFTLSMRSAHQVKLARYPKKRRGPKKPPPRKESGGRNHHISTARLLEKRRKKTP
jgi:hypothetical protein